MQPICFASVLELVDDQQTDFFVEERFCKLACIRALDERRIADAVSVGGRQQPVRVRRKGLLYR